MRVAFILAGVHAIMVTAAAIFKWPVPLEPIAWIRIVDFVVIWRISDLVQPALRIAGWLNPHPSLHQVADIAVVLYVMSFLLAGTVQWFLIIWGISKLTRILFNEPSRER